MDGYTKKESTMWKFCVCICKSYRMFSHKISTIQIEFARCLLLLVAHCFCQSLAKLILYNNVRYSLSLFLCSLNDKSGKSRTYSCLSYAPLLYLLPKELTAYLSTQLTTRTLLPLLLLTGRDYTLPPSSVYYSSMQCNIHCCTCTISRYTINWKRLK